MMLAALAALSLSQTAVFPNTEAKSESPRSMVTEVRLGSYYPWVDRGATCAPAECPYRKSFGGAMLLAELEVERQLFQAFGSAAVGLSIGYAEKFSHAIATNTGETTGEAIALRVLPMKALAVYRFDWAALRYHVPLVPYVKLGFELVYWWAAKGKGTEVAEGIAGNGLSYGVVGALGLAFLLDILDPRLARDFDTGMGVNHTYLFGEYNIAEVNNFGQKVGDVPATLDVSARFFMFGIAFEY